MSTFFLVLPCWFSRLSRSSIFIRHVRLGGSSFWYAFYVHSGGHFSLLERMLISRRRPLGWLVPPFSFFVFVLFVYSLLVLHITCIPSFLYKLYTVHIWAYYQFSFSVIFCFSYLYCTFVLHYKYVFFFWHLVYKHFVGYLFCLNHVSVMAFNSPFNSFGLILPYFGLEEDTGVLGPDRTVG